MPLPVSTTSAPRISPSVLSMAMVRTVRSPRCCATSSTSLPAGVSVVSAFWMLGSSAGNCTSTTAPRTCVTVPTLFFIVVSSICLVMRFTRRAKGALRSRHTASAPEMISISSRVMLACRVRL